MNQKLLLHPTLGTFFKKANALGWDVDYYYPNGFRFSIISPLGNPLHLYASGKTKQELVYSIYEFYSQYDVNEEAYLWLDSMGKEKGNDPSERMVIYKDVEFFEQQMLHLYQKVA